MALKAYFHFINNRFLNPKKAFWNAAKSWAADFCILIYSEYEKKKRYYSRYSFQKCQKTNTSYTFIFEHYCLWSSEEKLTSRALNAKTEDCTSSTQTEEAATIGRTFSKDKTQKCKSFLTLSYVSCIPCFGNYYQSFLHEKN